MKYEGLDPQTEGERFVEKQGNQNKSLEFVVVYQWTFSFVNCTMVKYECIEIYSVNSMCVCIYIHIHTHSQYIGIFSVLYL